MLPKERIKISALIIGPYRWDSGSVIKLLALHFKDPGLDLQPPYKKLSKVLITLLQGMQRQADPQSLVNLC